MSSQIWVVGLALSPHMGYRLLLRRCSYSEQGGSLHYRPFPERNSASSQAVTGLRDAQGWSLGDA